jgi:predicted patatin/cPLA2 family phospholipase
LYQHLPVIQRFTEQITSVSVMKTISNLTWEDEGSPRQAGRVCRSGSTSTSTKDSDDILLLSNLQRRAYEIRAGKQSEIVTGLVVQGGGSRGIYSMGALQELQESGLGSAFDHVFGASTGALNASCLLSGQADEAVDAYLNDMATPRFVNWLRPRKIVDVDFLVDQIVTAHRCLCVDRILKSPSRLHVVLTDALTRRAHVVTNRDAQVNWLEVLRATMALPWLYGRPVPLNGRTYLDGCLADPVPLLRALAAGCTDILVVLTISPHFRTNPSWLIDLLERPLLRGYPQEVRDLIRADRGRFNVTMDHIEHAHWRPNHVRLHVIYPSDARQMVSAIATNRHKLRTCALMGRSDARRFIV